MRNKKTSRRFVLLGVWAIFSAVIISCSSEKNDDKPDQKPKYGTGNQPATDCPTPLVWLDNAKVPEPNYKTFPCGYTVDSDGGATNLAFHEISWQYFLWLTETVDVKAKKMLRFESMFNDASINMKAINPKSKSHILAGIQQAGSNSVLVDENGRAVYTSMIINTTYRDFVRKNKLYTPDGLRDFSDTTNFPKGSMSMKASWKIVPKGEKPPKGAYTREATLYKVVNIDGNLTTSDNYKDPAKRETIKEQVALVGFHIAVVVNEHPEFIWATFEHNENAPSLLLKNSTEPVSDEYVSDKDFTFYKAKTPASMCNISNLGTLEIDENQKITGAYGVDAATQVYRRYQYGGGTDSNQINISNLNDLVHSKLPENSLWNNYHEVGAVWFNVADGLKPNWSLTLADSIETGSKTLSNSTIETFTQDPNQQNSCFSCHNTTSYNPTEGVGIEGKNVLTSHILLKNYYNTLHQGEVRQTVQRSK